MFNEAFLSSPIFNFIILPLLIFLARVCDVTIGTVRIMLISRGRKWIVPLLGFIEMMIWLLAVRQVILNVTNIACLFAFAGGFAMGNFIGIVIEEKLAIGREVIRVITKKDAGPLFEYLKLEGYGVTCVDAQGSMGKVNLLFMIIHRRDQKKVIDIINKYNPNAFFTVEDVKSVREGIFPKTNRFEKLFRFNFKLY